MSNTTVRNTQPDENGDFGWGLFVDGGAFLLAEDVVVEGNTGLGLLIGGQGTQVVIEDATFRETLPDPNGQIEAGIRVEESAMLSARDCLIDGNTRSGLLVAEPGTQVVLRDTLVMDTQPSTGGDGGRGVEVIHGATLVAEDCLLDGNTELGLLAAETDTHVTLLGATVSDTHPDTDGLAGWGIEVQGGAVLDMQGGLVERNTEVGILATGHGTEVHLLDTIIRDTLPNGIPESGRGMEVSGGATMYAEGILVDGNTNVGLIVGEAGTDVVLRNATVRGTREDGGLGQGIHVNSGATLLLDGCLIDRNTEIGVAVGNPGTRATLQDTVVKGTQFDTDGDYGRGIEVGDGATLSAGHCLIEGNTEVGISVTGMDTQAALWRTAVIDTGVDSGGMDGMGVSVRAGARLSADDCLIERNASIGLAVGDPGTQVTLRKTTVTGTLPDLEGGGGHGIEVINGAYFLSEGSLIEGNTALGIAVGSPGTQVALRSTTVRETRPNKDGRYGRGIIVQDGASLTAQDCNVEENTEVGLYVSGPDTQVNLWDSTFRETRPNGLDEGGRGVDIENGASLRAEGCVIDGNTEDGLFVADQDTQVIISDSSISNTQSGILFWSSAAAGVTVQNGASMIASLLIVESNKGPGIVVNANGMLECDECSLEGNEFAGVVVMAGGAITMLDSVIERTMPNVNLLGGAGVYAWQWNGDPPTVFLMDSLIQDNPIAGIWLIGNGAYLLGGNTIVGGVGADFGTGQRCGDAVLALDGVRAWDGVAGLLLQDNTLLDASGAGVFLDASAALMMGNSYAGNGLDLIVQNQICGSAPDCYREAPRRELCPVYDYPTCSEEFFYVAAPADPVR